MRPVIRLALAAGALVVAAVVTLAGLPARAAGSPLKVQVDKTKVDLKQHRLEVKMSHPAGKVKIQVFADSEASLADEEQDFTGRPAGSPLIVTWTPSSDAPVGRIEVHAYDAQGNWVGVELAPWFVPIPHEDVNFRTGSSDIDEPETPKLEAAFTKLQEVLAKDAAHGRMHAGITLYIAGHTDTVGTAAHNLKLSQDRARAIASWFRKRGVKLPISFEGFGETSPEVKTADNVDEPRNRRVDYVLSDGPPTYSAAFKPSWKRIP
ncbi:MAG TPA: OmpA family protein [Polyangia bacterium]|jgi:outer membrane protein OmpA-like peptidoglycan-associated protein|nr:OmpA family protein [Polyangia bacterium]